MEVDIVLLVIGLLFMFFVVMRYVSKAKIFNLLSIVSAVGLSLLLNNFYMYLTLALFIIVALLDLFWEA